MRKEPLRLQQRLRLRRRPDDLRRHARARRDQPVMSPAELESFARADRPRRPLHFDQQRASEEIPFAGRWNASNPPHPPASRSLQCDLARKETTIIKTLLAPRRGCRRFDRSPRRCPQSSPWPATAPNAARPLRALGHSRLSHVERPPRALKSGYRFGPRYSYTSYRALPRTYVSRYDLDPDYRYVYSDNYIYVVNPRPMR